MAPIPKFVLDAEGNKFWKEISLDIGTGTLVAYATVRKNGVQMQQPIPLKLQGQDMVASVVAWHDGKFHWGDDLMAAVNDGAVPAGKVINCLKLTLYEGFAARGSSSIKDRAMDQLAKAGKSVEETLAALFTHIVADTRESICKTQYLQYFDKQGPNFLESLPIKACITLPRSFGPEAGRKMRDAANAAKISQVAMASEQISALIAHMENEGGRVPGWARSAFILVDAGCGTTDSVKFQYLGGEGTDCRWEAIAQSSGSVSASQKINEYILEMFDAKIPGGIQHVCDELDMELNEVNFQFLQDIEAGKKVFDPRRHLNKSATFSIWRVTVTNCFTDKQYAIDLTSQMVQDASDKVFAENCPGIDELTKSDKSTKAGTPKYIVLCGGYGQSPYLRYQVEKRYGKLGIKVVTIVNRAGATLVAQGALSPRYDLIDAQKLPYRYGYAVLRDENYFVEIHIDCWVYNKIGYRIPITRKVKRRIYGASLEDRIVLSRLFFIARKGETIKDMTPVISVFAPFVDDRLVTLTLVCTTPDGLKDHDPALTDDHNVSRHDNKLRDGIMPWTMGSWTLDKDVMKLYGWNTAIDDETGKLRYQNVWVRASIVRDHGEENMTVDLELMLPGPNGGDPPKNYQTIKVKGSFKLWDGAQSEFLSDADAGTRMAVDADGDARMD